MTRPNDTDDQAGEDHTADDTTSSTRGDRTGDDRTGRDGGGRDSRRGDDRQGSDDAQGSATGGDATGGNGEAARYRRQLRDTETERDTLRGRVEGFQRAEAERLAAGDLATASDLWLFGLELSEVLDDAGEVDPDAVRAAAQKITTERPRLGRARRAGTARGGAAMGQGRSGHGGTGQSGTTWGKLLDPAERR